MRKKLLLPLIILVGLTGLTLALTSEQLTPVGTSAAVSETGNAPAVGGAFSLTDDAGNAVTDATYRGRIMLVFFGFTHCPDVCPASVATYATVLSELGEDAKQVAPIMISVDPARDTPQRMKEYLSAVDPRIIGLTGTPEQIKQAASAYKAFYSVTEPEHSEHMGGEHHTPPGVQVNHSSFIYVMTRDGVYARHFPYTAPPEEITAAIKELL